eukprot:TRINITY_DN4295_c0_g1_i1.p1 TRINITY_DN4295_c0_g1~~TRINITY_DN4295_c0_g1_i1.p1  ORF type:complete len:597 (-),score=136.60 TRINITY_DN4295_c0_g1_i1:238-2028(-)
MDFGSWRARGGRGMRGGSRGPYTRGRGRGRGRGTRDRFVDEATGEKKHMERPYSRPTSFSSNFSRDRSFTSTGQSAEFVLTGYPSDTAYPEMTEFLNSATPRFRWEKVVFKPNQTFLTVSSRDRAGVLSLHEKVLKGQKVQVSESDSKADFHPLSSKDKDVLSQYLRTKFDAKNQALNLEGMVAALSSSLRGGNFNNSRFVSMLGEVIASNCRDIKTINLASNDIESLASFHNFHQYAPVLANLALHANKIASFQELDNLRGYCLTLNELTLARNPIEQSTHEQIYHYEVSRRFPKLKLLDKQLIKQAIEFQLPSSISGESLAPPTRGSFFDSETTATLCTAFVIKYFQTYDSDSRGDSLVPVYAPTATFSLTVSADIPQVELPAEYGNLSRNLLETQVSLPPIPSTTSNTSSSSSSSSVSSLSSSSSSSFASSSSTSSASLHSAPSSILKMSEVESTVKTKPLHIATALDQLPKTKHSVSDFVADCFVLPMMQSSSSMPKLIYCGLNGVFLETVTGVIRSFSRTFILMPPSQQASIIKWPAVIVNDQLFIGPAVGQKQPTLSFASSSSSTSTASTPSFSSDLSVSSSGTLGLNLM